MRIKISAIYLLLFTSILLTLINAFITYDNIREKEESTNQIIHSHMIIQSSTQLLALFMDMETGQRGYIITGDHQFMESYRQAGRMVQDEINTLTGLMRDHTVHDHREGHVLKVAKEKQEDLEATLHVFEKYGKDSAIHLLATLHGKEKMDSVRRIVSQMTAREKKIVAEQVVILEGNKKLDPLRFSGFALTTITCLVAFVTIVRKEKRNVILLSKVRQSNRELESKVEKRTRQLVVANRAKDHFLGIATHDLKAPLNGIQGLVNLIKLHSADEVITEYLAYIEDACKKMQRLIADLLDLNRIDQGLSHISKEMVDLKSLLAKIEMEFFNQANKKGIRLLVNKVGHALHTDPDALSRILENLLSNAIKFSSADKTVQLITSRVGDHIQFEIKDEGPGIAENEIPQLFKKFQRLTNRPTDKESSTGLGLSIVKELTTLLGGMVEVKSKLGTGTTFIVSLPAPLPAIINQEVETELNYYQG